MVYVGDACEEHPETLIKPANELGEPRASRYSCSRKGAIQEARDRFQKIAEATHGAYHSFDQGSAKLLGELLKAVAAFAVGGVLALERQDFGRGEKVAGSGPLTNPSRWCASRSTISTARAIKIQSVRQTATFKKQTRPGFVCLCTVQNSP